MDVVCVLGEACALARVVEPAAREAPPVHCDNLELEEWSEQHAVYVHGKHHLPPARKFAALVGGELGKMESV